MNKPLTEAHHILVFVFAASVVELEPHNVEVLTPLLDLFQDGQVHHGDSVAAVMGIAVKEVVDVVRLRTIVLDTGEMTLKKFLLVDVL